jgi:hypothetical protein
MSRPDSKISFETGYRWLYKLLASKELTIGLLSVICLMLAVTTFTEENNVLIWNVIRIVLTTMVINLTLCTIKRIKVLSKSVLFIHIGVILTFIGGGISTYGFVATVNIYEGTVAEKVYRWDVEKDISLGVDLMVNQLHEEYYPVPVKVGVLKGQDKYGLYELKTGGSFNIENYHIRVDSIELPLQNLKLSIFEEGDHIGDANTMGNTELPADFPFEFKLVAYMSPVIKKTWVDLKLIKDSEIVAEGKTGVNSPLKWSGMNFYHTATNWDKSGNPFIGIQITKDPGIVYVYTGFVMVFLGCTYYLLRRMRGLR